MVGAGPTPRTVAGTVNAGRKEKEKNGGKEGGEEGTTSGRACSVVVSIVGHDPFEFLSPVSGCQGLRGPVA
eukprot:4428031-Heterocapsa_arctica.AAC.1